MEAGKLLLVTFALFTIQSTDAFRYYQPIPEELENESEYWFLRDARNGDLFSRLSAINKAIHAVQQLNCRKFGEMCSWAAVDKMKCCVDYSCRCSISGNCRCQ